MAAWLPVLGGIYATFRSRRAALADLGGSLPQAGADRVAWTELGELQLKGFAAPVRVLEARPA